MPMSFKDYWSTFVWNKKSILDKLYMFSIANLVVVPLSLIFFFWLKDQQGCPYGKNDFIYLDIVWNTSGAFGAFSNNFVAILVIQSLCSVGVFTVTIFVRERSYLFLLYIVLLGGLFNLIQRACINNAVLDYFHFGFWKEFAVFNMPDVMVVTGGFGLVINVFISVIFPRKAKKNVKN